MKRTVEEKVKFKLLKIGHKNRFCSILVVPLLAISMLFLRVPGYLVSNGKRFGMIAMTFFLFTVYSSFSFPVFITNTQENAFDYDSFTQSEAAQIELAKEEELNMENVQLLEDADVLSDEENTKIFSHGMEIVERYGAEEILQYTEGSKQEQEQATSPSKAQTASPDKENEVTFSADDWRLILINQQNSIPDDYEPVLGSIKTTKGIMKCDERIIDELLNMLQAAKEDGVSLEICSPYRDYKYQKMLFNRKINRYMSMGMSYMEAYQLTSRAVTVPGASEHQIGLALDIVSNTYSSLDEGFGKTDAGKWLKENSYQYGFILRYPKEKEYITGIQYEPWHFRYVGVEAATIIKEKEITLEEFWEEYL